MRKPDFLEARVAASLFRIVAPPGVAAVCAAMVLAACAAAVALPPPVLTEVQSFPGPGGIAQMEYSPAFDLLFLREGGNRVRVVDAATGSQIGTETSVETFTDFDLTPDGRYLFVADYGGTHTGYGTPTRPHWVHRFDLAAKTWETKKAPTIAYRIEAVSPERLLILEQDQWVDVLLDDFGSSPGDAIVEVARRGVGYRGDIEFDPQTGRIYHGNSGSSSHEITVLTLAGDSLVSSGGTGTYGTAQGYRGSSVLSTGGEVFYYGRLQVEAADVRNNLHVFPESIRAANPLVAFGKDKYYDAATGDELGRLGYAGSAHALSDDGGHLWVTGPGNTLHHYAVIPEPSTVTLAALGFLGLLGFTRRRGRGSRY